MKETVLITGGYGFLGRAVARKLQQHGCRIVGLGRGRWGPEEAKAHGFDVWLDANVSLASLMTLQDRFELVVHCGGNGSVGYSLEHPLQDFEKTVQGTIELLEYLRVTKSHARVVYPSSAGVYGAKDDAPISVGAVPNPISPYGYHKRIVEQLMESYSRSYGIPIAIIRFFSIYGPGLTKQLLWDAGRKLLANRGGVATFWGTGEETRDWITSDDAAQLVLDVARCDRQSIVVNGASGRRVTVRKTLEILRAALGVNAEVCFNNTVREGDPRFYHADVTDSLNLGWKPSITLEQGIQRYADWLVTHEEHKLD
jgi:UDP-glucose 4-epimerase